MHIKEMAQITGVSVRTLRYYDKIGLLKPAAVDEQNGYRLYDRRSLERMQEILFYRELDFPLKAISEILSSPDYDKTLALKEQKALLTIKRDRLERLINALDGALKGELIMNFKVFDNSDYESRSEKFSDEVRRKWGGTKAYEECTAKTAAYTEEKWKEVNNGMEKLIAGFADCMRSGDTPSSSAAQSLVKKWQDFISKNYYSCTKEILSGLGEMYSCDERFTENIDRSGSGTQHL